MEAAPDSVRRARPLLGTFVEITASHVSLADALLAVGSLAELEVAVEEAFEAVARVHRLMSFHDPASDLSRLNREAGTNPVTIDAWTFEVLEIAVGLNRHSAGVFDINVAPALQALGLLPDARQYQVQHQVQDSASRRIEDAIELLPGFQVRFRQPCVKIDLGGIAKGFAVDRALDVLRHKGMTQGLVNAGGDLAAFGPQPQTVYIRNPSNPQRLLCSVRVMDGALASSGGRIDLFQASGIANCAIIDPHTQEPVTAAAGATVAAPTCVVADGLTKVVMIQGADATPLLDRYRASAMLVLADGSTCATSTWHEEERFAA
jgi:FAD:protein FMN transferase